MEPKNAVTKSTIKGVTKGRINSAQQKLDRLKAELSKRNHTADGAKRLRQKIRMQSEMLRNLKANVKEPKDAS